MLGQLTGRRVVLVVADDVGQVLDERASVGDVEQLHAAADGQHRQAAAFRSVDEGELAIVSPTTRWLSARVRLGTVAGGIDVGAACQHQAVEAFDEAVEILVALVLDREDDRGRARPRERVHIARRHERGLGVPGAPAGELLVGGHPDDGARGVLGGHQRGVT